MANAREAIEGPSWKCIVKKGREIPDDVQTEIAPTIAA